MDIIPQKIGSLTFWKFIEETIVFVTLMLMNNRMLALTVFKICLYRFASLHNYQSSARFSTQ